MKTRAGLDRGERACRNQAVTPATQANTLPKLLMQQAKRLGDRVALRRKNFGIWDEISWKEYAERARWVGCGLLKLGVAREECVALISENRPKWLYVDLGIQAIGAITAAIYVTSAPEQVAYIIDHSQSKVIFVEDEEQLDKVLKTRDKLEKLERIVVFEWKGLRGFEDPMVMKFEDFLNMGREYAVADGKEFEGRLSAGKPEECALLVYTSGTTGPPKGAMLSHDNLIWTAGSLSQANHIEESDQVLSFLPLCHVAERLMTVVNQLVHGYTVNFAENLDTVPQNLREVSPTVFFAVPRIWEKFYSRVLLTMDRSALSKKIAYRAAIRVGERVAQLKTEGKKPGPALAALYRLAHFSVFHPLKKRLGLERTRLAISGAAPISPKLLTYFHALGLNLREVYGQTEGSGPTTIHHGADIKFGTVGKPLPGVEVKIAQDGEILVRGRNVFLGYYRNPEASSKTLVNGYLHSGDVGELEDGYLRITDRKKDLIITAGGKNIAPQNIENQLKFSPYINDAVVIGDRRPFLIAIIVIDEENVSNWAQENRIPFTTYADLATNEEIHKLIQEEVRKVNKTLAKVEQVKNFAILDKRLEEEDGDVTPTMKVKRKNIEKTYSDVIESMYSRRHRKKS
jgi:long-chain acyl-CoA synthetase